MPKRTAEEKIAKYEAKIRKLMDGKKRRSSRVIYSDDDDDTQEQIGAQSYIEDENCNFSEEMPIEPEAEQQDGKDEVVPTTSAQTNSATGSTDLDPELLLALGESTSDALDFGPDIHDSLANLWQPVLKKGLADANRDCILKSYPVPGNCKLLLAPKLNDEISSAVPTVARGRDKKLHTLQQQLGTGVTAVNEGMNIILSSGNKVEALKNLSDNCRILCDLHFALSKYRIKLVTPSLDKKFLHVLQDTQRDELLFGAELGEKIKASKAIEKQGQQIKKNLPVQKPAALQSTAARPSYVPSGNWSAPPHYHYPSTRGGRGGARRPAAATRKQTNTTYNRTTQPKGRAQAQQ